MWGGSWKLEPPVKYAIAVLSSVSLMKIGVLTHGFSFQNETPLSDYFVVWLQSLQNRVIAICRRAEANLAQHKTSFTVLDRQEYDLSVANRLHSGLGHDRTYAPLGREVDIHVHLYPQVFTLSSFRACVGTQQSCLEV